MVATLPTSRAALPPQPSSPSAFGRHTKGMLPGNLPVGAGCWWRWAVPGAAGCGWPWVSFTHHGQLARSVMWRSSTWAKSLVEDSLHPILPNVDVVQLLPPLLQPLEPKAWVPKWETPEFSFGSSLCCHAGVATPSLSPLRFGKESTALQLGGISKGRAVMAEHPARAPLGALGLLLVLFAG